MCSKCAPGMFQVCPRCVPGMLQVCPRYVPGVLQVCSGCAPGVCYAHPVTEAQVLACPTLSSDKTPGLCHAFGEGGVGWSLPALQPWAHRHPPHRDPTPGQAGHLDQASPASAPACSPGPRQVGATPPHPAPLVASSPLGWEEHWLQPSCSFSSSPKQRRGLQAEGTGSERQSHLLGVSQRKVARAGFEPRLPCLQSFQMSPSCPSEAASVSGPWLPHRRGLTSKMRAEEPPAPNSRCRPRSRKAQASPGKAPVPPGTQPGHPAEHSPGQALSSCFGFLRRERGREGGQQGRAATRPSPPRGCGCGPGSPRCRRGHFLRFCCHRGVTRQGREMGETDGCAGAGRLGGGQGERPHCPSSEEMIG